MSSILDVLNEEQVKACQAVDGPVMLFAGAGTGKTRTLTARIAYMVQEHNIRPYNILAITFTKKATNEMRERLYAILDDDARYLNISTIHSLCVKILRHFIDKIGYSNNFEIIDDEDQIKIISDIYKNLNIDKRILSPKTACKIIGDYKNGMGILNDFMQPVYDLYKKYLKENNYLDFDDLLLKTLELFQTDEACLDYYQRQFLYILVDEFQDTNKIQYDIIKLLANKNRNLFVVGDDDQSIYSFRGACVDNMLGFTKDYPDAKVYKLEKNYRSHNSILKGANALISCNETREKKQLYSDVDGSLDDVIIQEAYFYDQEVRYVTNEIRSLVSDGYCDYKDIAVLYRNSALSRNFELSFVEERIPYNIYGGFSYLKRKEVKDVVSYFRFICDPSRMAHFKRILACEGRGVGEKSVQKLIDLMNKDNIDIFTAIERTYEANPSTKNQELLDFKNELTDLIDKIEKMPLVEFFDYLMDKTGYLNKLKEEDMNSETHRVDNINEFKSILYNIDNSFYEEELTKKEKVQIGLDEIMLDTSFEEDERSNAVTLSTIHSIKGLEFEVVFVVALEEGIFPSLREDMDIEEERRVAYVAFTRAKSKIYLSCAQQRLIYGRMVRNPISRFLREYLLAEEVKENVERQKEIEESREGGEVKVGAKVNHKYFGEGVIVSIDENYLQIVFEKDKSIKKIKRDYPFIKILM